MCNIRIKETEVVKSNDSRVHGLMLMPEDDCVGRSVYLDDLYERHEEGEDINILMDEMIARCESGLAAEGPPLMKVIELDFDSIRTRLTVRLLGVRNNISYMAERPYIDVGNGLALVAVINCEPSSASEWVISVTNSLLRDHIGCDRETLLTAALENTIRMEPPLLVRLEEHMYANYVMPGYVPNYLDVRPDQEKMSGAFMLTNSSAVFGAAALFYPGVMERIAEAFGCGYYILPSSIHELILLPDTMKPDVNELRATVCEANATVIDREDLLSWNVFHYDPVDGKLQIAKRNCVKAAS